MKRISIILTLLCVTILTNAQNLTGYWRGTMSLMGQEFDTAFDIKQENENLSATFDIITQGVYNLPVSSIEIDNLSLTIKIDQIGATFKGTYIMNTFIGEFSQNGIKAPLTLAKGNRPEIARPQNPKLPYPYKEEEVTFKNKREDFTLAGTLTIPEGEGPFPAVVLISGSGSQDRNEELMNHKPFWVIADYLTRNGVAVLRYDDRGVGGSEAGNPNGTSMDLSYDAEGALDFLLEDKRINKTQIGLLGHSEGGVINYMVAARRADVAFLISLAGPAVTGAECLRVQFRELLLSQGVPEAAIGEVVKGQYAAIDIVESSSELTPDLGDKIKEKMLSLGVSEMEVKQVSSQFSSPWMYYFLKYNPSEAIKSVDIPALILNGSKDRQVSAAQNIAEYKKLAEKYGKKKMTIIEVPEANHLFQKCKTGSPTEYGIIEETISPEVLKLVSDFINEL